ncbi:MAG: A/G-specific adenine glycosylase [Thiobacillaceae bacterium]|nr:A/G-specific adenine glycosylase [Thiobacillaceae bacterium]
MPDFAARIVDWQGRCGRHGLPWQGGGDPYAIWVSEIMLQQTQVETVIPYYRRFLARFPDIAALAAAPPDEVLALWSGLGYYARGRNLHAAARLIVERHGGAFPRRHEDILALPGIGRSTAAAIAAFAYGERRAILDGNVKRVLARVFGVEGWPGERAVEDRLWALAEDLLPGRDLRAYTQGLMDLGATVCTRSRPRCAACPLQTDCVASSQGRQAELPGPRPRKALPSRATAMLVLLHAGQVLLERRPPTGIWGGLWSLPEGAVDEDPAAAAARLGCQVDSARPLPGLTHAFTHFRLAISPWRLEVRRCPAAESPGRLWLPLEEALGAALPSPVRRLLDGLARSDEG